MLRARAAISQIRVSLPDEFKEVLRLIAWHLRLRPVAVQLLIAHGDEF